MNEFSALLEAGDIRGLMAASKRIAPNMPQPKDLIDAEVTMHMARTASEQVTLKARAYSHRWLTERNYRSQLPDHLKAPAERMYPKVVTSVGISVNFQSKYMKGAEVEVRGSMEDAVMESYCDGKQDDTAFVKSRMMEAREKTMKKLFG